MIERPLTTISFWVAWARVSVPVLRIEHGHAYASPCHPRECGTVRGDEWSDLATCAARTAGMAVSRVRFYTATEFSVGTMLRESVGRRLGCRSAHMAASALRGLWML